MSDRNDTSPESRRDAEITAIIRTGTVWLAAVIVTAALLLGPAVAAGWRPSDLGAASAVWWIGAVVAAAGVALLVWAGCPVPAYTPERAHAQKVFAIRVGIVLSLTGMTLAGLVVLLAPVG